MKQSTKEWLIAAKDDLLTIKEIISLEHLTNVVAFHAEQAIEKSLKAIMEEYEKPLRMHDLVKLFHQVKKYVELEINVDELRILNELYIDSRYPGNFGLLPNGKPTLMDANNFYKLAKEIYQKVDHFLSNKE